MEQNGQAGIFLSYSDADFIAKAIRSFYAYVSGSMESGEELSKKIDAYSRESHMDLSVIQSAWGKVKDEQQKQLEPINRCLELLLCGTEGDKDKKSFDIYDITSGNDFLVNIPSLDYIPRLFSEMEKETHGYKRLLFKDTSTGENFELGKLLG